MKLVIYIIVLAVAYAACWRKRAALRTLGLIMMAASVVIAPSAYYLIEMGGFPGDATLTCGFWAVVCVLGLITFAVNRRQEKPAQPASLGTCPHGHGPLIMWNGKPRCLNCGWPEEKPIQIGKQVVEEELSGQSAEDTGERPSGESRS